MTTQENKTIDTALKELDFDSQSLDAFREFVANNPKDPKVLKMYEILAKIEEIQKNE